MISIRSLSIVTTILTGCLAAHRADADATFERAAAVLASHCVHCHNDLQRDGDFSLQSWASLADSGMVVPGDPSSGLLVAIQSDGDEPPQMPKEAKPLSPADVDAVRTWIESGAEWPTGRRIDQPVNDFAWWSLAALNRPPVPDDASDWIRTPVDAFILQALKQRQLTPAPPADRRTLIRRLTFDLTGLPPTPHEVDAFIGDTDPLAYETLVDRLLGSKHYGERWARHWLDVVKYADTCGYDKDKLRPNAWPYRDYVVRSLNHDKSYDRFVQEQVAGDVLFPGEADGILGLGFIAAGPWDFIGHVEVPESKIDGKVARNLDRDDMVANTLNTFCSVTIECARCHNHKFDPFTQEHYYSLQAIFAAVDRADRVYQSDPHIDQQRAKLQGELAEHEARKRELVNEIAASGGDRLQALDRQIEQLRAAAGLQQNPEYGFHSGIADNQLASKWVAVDLGRAVELSAIVLHPCHDEFAGIGAGFGFPVRFQVEVSDGETWTKIHDCDRDLPNPGLGPIVISAADQPIRRIKVTANKLALRDNDFIFALAELRALDADGQNVAAGADVTSADSIEAPVRWSTTNLVDEKWPRPLDTMSHDLLIERQAEREKLAATIETPARLARRNEIDESIKSVQQQLAALPTGKLVYAAATKFRPNGQFQPTLGKPRSIHLLARGNVTQPLNELGPGLLPTRAGDQWRLPTTISEAERRAALARWLTDRDNPLVWRSIVNRVWQYHFGQGLVATPNDFGRMGATPTHPELLDWLAVEFRDRGQSLKSLHRLIVTSSVYRQSSRYDEASAAVDSNNQLLWRMNRRRLSAEEIRDAVLAVSGALNTEMGGPGFYLFELEKTEHSPHYEYHKFDPADPKSHRRSIYRFIVRSQPDPFMTTLDCADSSQSTPRRIETLTSLQALSLLNNRFNLEMAERFARRLEDLSEHPPTQICEAMRLVAGRSPSPQEAAALSSYADRHGMNNLCRMLFNLSEFVYLD